LKTPIPRFRQLKRVRGFYVPVYNQAVMEKNFITSNPEVMMGKPVIAGTRITVELILEKLAAGENVEQILDAHPRLTREAVSAALTYAAQNLPAHFPEAA
jgi:uncharacterized protein (DUF433 family)